MSVNLAPGPFGAGGQFFDTNGKPLNAGFINTYAAGTTTPLATFTTNIGNVPNATTITLGVDGRPPNEIWLTAGSSYRFDLLDSLNNLIKTYDNLSGVNDISGIGEWILISLTPVFIGSTSFSLTGNQTTLLPNGMRLKTVNTGGTMYGKVVSSSYSAIPNTTTVVVANDVGSALDAGLSTISYSILSPANPSVDSDYVLRKATLITSAGVTNIWAIAGDYAHITGGTVTTITSFGTALYAGNERTVVADGAFTVANNAAIQTLSSATITAVAGDSLVVRAETTTVAKVVNYVKLSGQPAVYPILTVTSSALTGDVLLNSTTQYFTGPQVTQGSVGTWFASGAVTCSDSAGTANFNVKLWDGTTVIASGQGQGAINVTVVIHLSGPIVSPVGNIRISVNDNNSASGKILFNASGNSKDGTLTAVRIG